MLCTEPLYSDPEKASHLVPGGGGIIFLLYHPTFEFDFTALVDSLALPPSINNFLRVGPIYQEV